MLMGPETAPPCSWVAADDEDGLALVALDSSAAKAGTEEM